MTRAKASKQTRMNACKKYYAGIYTTEQISAMYDISPKTFDNWKEAYMQHITDKQKEKGDENHNLVDAQAKCKENGFVRVSASAGYWRW